MKKIFGTILMAVLSVSFMTAQTADEIAKKYVEAIGGAAKWQAIKTRKTNATMFASGMQFPGVIYEDNRNRQRVEFDVQGMKIIQAYDGETAWTQNPPQGMPKPTKLTGAQAEPMKQNEFLNDFIDYKKRGMKLEMKGEEAIGGKSYYRIDLTKAGGETIKYYFNKDSYLVEATKQMNPAIGQEATSYLTDYKEFGGIKIPTKVKVTVGGMELQTIQIDSMEMNVPVTDELFAFPGN